MTRSVFGAAPTGCRRHLAARMGLNPPLLASPWCRGRARDLVGCRPRGMRDAVLQQIEVVDVRGVSRSFGGRPVLRGVTTRFEPGTITFVEGPNGAGKSTLLGILGMALTPTSGTVSYPPIGSDPSAVRSVLGWLSHDSRAYRDLSGRENVELSARLYGVDPFEGFDRVSARLGLSDFSEQRVGTLSRGQRQRVALARAVVHDPAVILLDEPLTGLDADSATRVIAWLETERDRGAIVVVVSHVEGLPERVGGRRLRLERGRVVRDERCSPAPPA